VPHSAHTSLASAACLDMMALILGVETSLQLWCAYCCQGAGCRHAQDMVPEIGESSSPAVGGLSHLHRCGLGAVLIGLLPHHSQEVQEQHLLIQNLHCCPTGHPLHCMG
jgi:hypothetical protein